MTTLYRPVRIETAEQAEALPVGTMAHATETGADGTPLHWAAVKFGSGTWARTDVADGLPMIDNATMVDPENPWTALVPIEAEEEHKGIQVFPRPDDAPWPPGATPNQDTDGRWYFIDEDDRSVGLWDYAHPFHDAMVAWLDAQPSTTRLVTPWESA